MNQIMNEDNDECTSVHFISFLGGWSFSKCCCPRGPPLMLQFVEQKQNESVLYLESTVFVK